jgi:predicted 3-demethylubiquinone-9 3-methyltransferase (glyoxalase superfamily)
MSNPIYPCLWFDGQAKEAASFYCTVFNNSSITSENPMVVIFDLEGQKTMALNGGPVFKINPSISFFVNCSSIEEIDNLWNKLSDGGSALMALDTYPWSPKYGWVKDKFGLTWQLMLGDFPAGMPKIIPSFLFSNNQFGKAKAAIEYYTSIFPNSKINPLQLYAENEVQPVGNVKFGHFELNNKLFAAMDGPGNHEFDFNEGFSLVVDCANQEEIDFYWEKLTLGGQESMCGWLKDQFGVSWQIVPQILGSLMNNPEKANKVMQAFLKMKKFDIQALLDA